VTSVFISYRRSDGSGWVGRLYDRLESAFGADSVFYDIDSIAGGEDFAASVEKRLSTCDTAIVVIGPSWLEARAPDGSRRLDQPKDHVRKEIELALKRGITVIPVLVGTAEMPAAERLPESIAALANRNALRVSDTGFKNDIDRLIGAIQRAGGGTTKGPKPASLSRRMGYLAAAFAVAGALVVGLQRWSDRAPAAPQTAEQARPDTSQTIDLAAILGEEKGIEVYCKGFSEGSVQMLMEMKYGGAVVPECSTPNNVPLFNFVEAWCHGFSDGANQSARQLSDQFLSITEVNRRYDLCVAGRRWETAKK